MNRMLDTTDTAFGRAVQNLNFRRRTLSAKLLWSPLSQDWEMSAPLPEPRGATLTIPHEVLEHVTRLDRLARSTRDLLNTLAAITGRKAGFRSLGDPWADTTTSHGWLMLTVLGGLAEFERDLIRTRTGEGRARAVARGQKMGRPFKLTDHQKREAIKRRNQGETLADIARSYNVSPATISRLTE